MSFCPNCGVERKEGSHFCHHCGYDYRGANSSWIGSSSSSDSQVNQNPSFNSQVNQSSTYNVPTKQNPHNFAKITGYILSFLIPVFAIIIGIYLILSKNEEVHKHGIIIIGISIVVQILSMIFMMG